MTLTKNTIYYASVAGLVILLKFSFTGADNDALFFLLQPTDKLIGFLTGSQSVYLSAYGYYHNRLGIVIDKSCSGYNFWMLCFTMLSFLSLKHLDHHPRKVLVIAAALAGAYLMTIFVNTSRIFASLMIQNQLFQFTGDGYHLAHEAIGVITNLSFLIMIYHLLEKILIQKYNNAKPV